MYEHATRLTKRFGKPLLITESGCATRDCDFRIAAMKDYFHVLRRLLDDGVDVWGMFHWSTISNTEWNLGNRLKFG